MKYDFTSILEREGKDAIALDGIGKYPGFSPEPPEKGFDIIPMWVADMNFPTVPTIISAISERLKYPHFGYFMKREEYTNSIIDWHLKRHGTTDLTKEDIGYQNGVLGGIVSALNIYCSKGDKVLVHSPLYIGFKSILENNGYKIIISDLIKDEKGIYRMDYEDMEKKLKIIKFMQQFFALLITPVEEYGKKKKF